MKLNYKQTIWVGMAFLIICLFWQVYDTVLARVLVNSFGLNQTWSGVVLAIDNIVALFLIPVFGVISDKTHTKWGRRTPFIVIGTVTAALIFLFVGMFVSLQDKKVKEAGIEPVYSCVVVDAGYTPKEGEIIYHDYVFADADGTFKTQKEKETDDLSIKVFFQKIFSRQTPEYVDSSVEIDKKAYVFNYNGNIYAFSDKESASDMRSTYASTIMQGNVGYFIGFMIILCVVLVAMGSFRSPAVALMPDVTPKPLRSKANAIINLTGTVGGIIALGYLTFLDTDFGNHIWTFVVLSILMLAFLALFLWKVHEPKLVQERIETEREYGILEENATSAEDEAAKANTEKSKERMPKDVKKSFVFLMASIVLWFFAYNAATSKYSVYATNVLNTSYSITLIVAQAVAVICYIPIGFLATKIGRKKTILIGIVILFTAFLLGSFVTEDTAGLMYLAMGLAGMGWATINVNSFPMVVEMCNGADVGRYTGYYYTASMAAQIATPIISGMFMDVMGMRVLFPYSCVFAVLAFLTMVFVKHGDSKPVPTAKLETLGGPEGD